MGFAQFQRAIPRGVRMRDDIGLRARRMIERHGRHGQRFIAARFRMRGTAMVADHAQHVRGVFLVAGKGAEFFRHLRRSGVADAGHHSGEGTAQRTAFIRVVRQTHRHQQAADVRITKTERAVLVREFGDRLGRKLRHHHRDFQHDGPQPAQMLIGVDVETSCLRVVERQQVRRREVTRRIVQEHVFRTWVRRADVAAGLAGVPVVHRGVEVQAGIGGGPCGVTDLFPQIARLEGLHHLLVGASDKIPVAVGFHRAQEIVLERHRVVGVLARNGEVRLGIPVGVVHIERNIRVALLGELHHALDEIVLHHGAARELDLAAQSRVLFRIEAIVA